MDNTNQIQRLNSSLIEIVKLYQDIIQEMDMVMTIVNRELSGLESDGVVKLTMIHSNEKCKRKLQEIDGILKSIKQEFGLVSPIIH